MRRLTKNSQALRAAKNLRAAILCPCAVAFQANRFAEFTLSRCPLRFLASLGMTGEGLSMTEKEKAFMNDKAKAFMR
jgi:hypothetical protein